MIPETLAAAVVLVLPEYAAPVTVTQEPCRTVVLAWFRAFREVQ
jgi:hypothetical protein